MSEPMSLDADDGSGSDAMVSVAVDFLALFLLTALAAVAVAGLL